MSVTIDGTSGITSPGLNSTGNNTLGDAASDVLNVGNGTIVTDASGNVGIGTSSPQYKLDVTGNIRATTQVFGPNGSAATPSISSSGETNAGLFFGDDGVGSWMGFATASGERMRIDRSGNLLVGTTSVNPAQGFAFSPVSNAYQLISHANGVASGNWYIGFSYNAGNIGSIAQNGTTGVSYNTSSDYRLKENIQPMQGALDVVAQLNPVTYTWKADGSDGQGFIAHELQAVVPDCVTGEKDAVDAEGKPVYQGIDTSFLVATLCKAIQELSAKNDALETRLAALEAK